MIYYTHLNNDKADARFLDLLGKIFLLQKNFQLVHLNSYANKKTSSSISRSTIFTFKALLFVHYYITIVIAKFPILNVAITI